MRMWELAGRACYWLAWPGLWLYMCLGIERTRVVVRYGNEILVVRDWLGDGRWALPGGGLHQRETPLAGACREVAEETGIKLNPQDLEDAGKHRYQKHGLSFTYFLFLGEHQTKPAVRAQFPELTAVAWVQSSELQVANAGPDVLQALALLAARS